MGLCPRLDHECGGYAVTLYNKGLVRGRVLLWAVLLCLLPTGCSETPQAENTELLIYCGITMIRPVSEIAAIVEEEENCKFIITKGGSGNLLKSIRINGVGDLYLPGSESYIQTCLDEGLVTDTALVGYNKAAIMVQKGNPKQITSDLNNLACEEYYVVIGNPNSGSIGRETQKILQNKGIYEAVQTNARELTTDSKMLFTVLKEHKADIVINWFATSTWDDNGDYVDVLSIDETYAKKKRLVLGLLKTSKYPAIARRFMEVASSNRGRALFAKYGLYDVK